MVFYLVRDDSVLWLIASSTQGNSRCRMQAFIGLDWIKDSAEACTTGDRIRLFSVGNDIR